MSFEACAEIVRKGDPDRFLATMAAPVKDRAALFALFAFNIEVARAPWVSAEPMVNEIRLQWWRDAIGEIAAGKPVRAHEVTGQLVHFLDAEGARLLDALIEARFRDVYGDPFADEAALNAYLEATGAGLMWAAARAIGVRDGEAAIRDVGYSAGLANWFLAVPELRARGRHPLPDNGEAAIRLLANRGLQRLKSGYKSVPARARPATRTGWRASRVLRSAAANPAAVIDGGLHISEFSRKSALLWRVFSGAP